MVRLLEGRALALRALGREDEVDLELQRLAALRPEHTFSSRVPPEIVHRFRVLLERGVERLRARVQIRGEEGRLFFDLVLSRDPGGLVREATLYARVGNGEWQAASENELVIEVQDDQQVEYFARVIGLGGALLVEHGTEFAPLPALVTSRLIAPEPADAPAATTATTDPWPWVLGSAGLLAAAGIVVAVVFATSSGTPVSDDTRLSPPRPAAEMLRF